MNEKLEKLKKMKSEVTELERLEYEKMFVEKYGKLTKQQPFWLGGKTTKQLFTIMREYVLDYQKAYNKKPEWMESEYMFPNYTANLNKDKIRVDIDTFKQIMRQVFRGEL